MLINYDELWKKGGYAKDNPLENTIALIIKESGRLGLSQEAGEAIINEVFLEVAAGKQYPIDKCPCGCGIDKSGTAITHEMIKRLHAFDQSIKLQAKSLLQDRLNAAVLGHISKQNEEYIAENTKPTRVQKVWAYLNKPVSEVFSKES